MALVVILAAAVVVVVLASRDSTAESRQSATLQTATATTTRRNTSAPPPTFSPSQPTRSSGLKIKAASAAKTVADFVSQKTTFKLQASAVTCPDGVVATVGVAFDCFFTGPDGNYVAHLRIREIQGDAVRFDIQTELER